MRRTLLVVNVLCLAALTTPARAANEDGAPAPSRLEVGPFRTADGLEVAVVTWRDVHEPVVCVSGSRVDTRGTERTAISEPVCTHEPGSALHAPDHRFDPVSWEGAVRATVRSSVFVEDSTLQPNGDWTAVRSTSRQAETQVSLRWHGKDLATPVLGGMHNLCAVCPRPSLGLRRGAAVTGVVRFAAFGDVNFVGSEPAWTEVSTRATG